MKDNEKGFTLVEVVVSISIGLVVLGMVLSFILTSFNLYGNYATTDQRKLADDNIMDYIHSMLNNATDVRIKSIKNTETPINGAPSTKLNENANWHYMYVNEQGRLVVDEKVMFGGREQTDTYYGSKESLFSLKYTVSKGSDNFLTLNLNGTLSNKNDEGTDKFQGSYSKEDAILLSGLPSSYSSLSSNNEGKLTATNEEKEINRNTILYFANEKELSVQEPVEATYTIADKLNLLSDENRNQGAFTPSRLPEYQPGQIVTYNGFTYMRTATIDVDKYSCNIQVGDIQKFGNYYIVNIKSDKNAISLYVPPDYIKENSKTNSHYDLKFSESSDNGAIAGAVKNDESERYLTSHPNLSAKSSYFDVVYYSKDLSSQEANVSRNNYYTGCITLAPGACIQFGSIYIYSGWERLATKSVLSVPTSTPEPAEFDPNSIYLPGDLVTYKDNLYEVTQMSTGTTSVPTTAHPNLKPGHQLFDDNGNLQSLPGATNYRYGGGPNVPNVMMVKIGNYETILKDIETARKNHTENTILDKYTYWDPMDKKMGNKNNGTGYFGNSGQKYDNNPTYADRANLINWCHPQSDTNPDLTGIYSEIPQN